MKVLKRTRCKQKKSGILDKLARGSSAPGEATARACPRRRSRSAGESDALAPVGLSEPVFEADQARLLVDDRARATPEAIAVDAAPATEVVASLPAAVELSPTVLAQAAGLGLVSVGISLGQSRLGPRGPYRA